MKSKMKYSILKGVQPLLFRRQTHNTRATIRINQWLTVMDPNNKILAIHYSKLRMSPLDYYHPIRRSILAPGAN